MTNVLGAGSLPLKNLRGLLKACDADPTAGLSCLDWAVVMYYTKPAAPSVVPSEKTTWFIMSCKRKEKLA
jgi:hypothetical protein